MVFFTVIGRIEKKGPLFARPRTHKRRQNSFCFAALSSSALEAQTKNSRDVCKVETLVNVNSFQTV
jgi:hypothetical protein